MPKKTKGTEIITETMIAVQTQIDKFTSQISEYEADIVLLNNLKNKKETELDSLDKDLKKLEK